MRCLTDLDHSNSKQKRREQRARTHERCKNYSVELRAQNRNLRSVVEFHYEVAAVAGFHYEIYRPAATQSDWSTSLSCGLILIINGKFSDRNSLRIYYHEIQKFSQNNRF